MRIHRDPLSHIVYSLERVVKVLAIIFLAAPAILVVVLSFSGDDQMIFPPESWGFRQYDALFSSGYWLASIGKAALVALPTSALATVVGVPAVLALERSRMPLRGLVRTLGIAPLILPGVAYALALYTLFAKLGLLATFSGLVLADTMIALPFVLIVVGAGLRRIPSDLELVAMSLGASRPRATLGITIRLLMPSIVAALLLSFVTVFDEAVFVTFLGGGEIITLPKAIFDSFRDGIDPLITAVSTLLMVLTGVLMLAIERLRGQGLGA